MPKSTTYIEAGSGDMRDAGNYDHGIPVDGDTLIMTDPVPTIALDSAVTLSAYDGSQLSVGFPTGGSGADPSARLVIASGGSWSTAAGDWSGDATLAGSGSFSGGGVAHGPVGDHCQISGGCETRGGAGDDCTWQNAINSSAAGDHAHFDASTNTGALGDFATFDNGSQCSAADFGEAATFGQSCALTSGRCLGTALRWTGGDGSINDADGTLDLGNTLITVLTGAALEIDNLHGGITGPAGLSLANGATVIIGFNGVQCELQVPITLPADADVRAGTHFGFEVSHTGSLVVPGPPPAVAPPGRYSAQADLENVAGRQNLSVYSQLDGAGGGPGSDGGADIGRIAAAMQYADAFIDRALRDGPYLVPLSVATDGPLLTHWAAVIAVHWLYSARWFASQAGGQNSGNPFAPLLAEVLSDLSRCKSGAQRLASPRRWPGPTAPSAA